MKNSMDDEQNYEKFSSSLQNICSNEIKIRNHIYIISMCLRNLDECQLILHVQLKDTNHQWKSSYTVSTIETITAKTGNFKSFDVFVRMLENAINQTNPSVEVDILNSDDIDSIRQKKHSHTKSSTKRYLILVYTNEYEQVYYPLSLRYSPKADSTILFEQIRQLMTENQLLKSQIQSDFEVECLRLKQENDEYRQQISMINTHEKDKKIEYLCEMIRKNEHDLAKQENRMKMEKRKIDNHYKGLLNQIDLLKTSERQLKVKVNELTNQIDFIKKNGTVRHIRKRSTSASRPMPINPTEIRSTSQLRHVIPSSDSQIRFNPTAYILEKNLKLQQIELQKKRETTLRLNSAQRCANSDTDANVKTIYHRPPSSARKTSSRMRKHFHLNERQSRTSIDSDIERIPLPLVLYEPATNNSTLFFSSEHEQNEEQKQNSILKLSTDINHMNEIDKRLKSLEKFFKQNLRH